MQSRYFVLLLLLLIGCRTKVEFLQQKRITIGFNEKKGCKDKRFKQIRFFYDKDKKLVRKEIIKYGACGIVNEFGPIRAIRSKKTIVYENGKVVKRERK